jgi:formylmethanofuran--tetrahydromethanopterin N-formyltransferase
MDSDSLGKRLTERIGQTVLTCPTASCFDGLPDAPDRLPAARALRTFGDRFQISKVVNGERYWRVPVMEGECLLQESFGMQKKAVGGGNSHPPRTWQRARAAGPRSTRSTARPA